MASREQERETRYWRERFVQLEATSHKTALERLDSIDAGYRQAGREIEQNLSVWYQRFAVNNGIDLREAKQWLNAGELKEFKWTVQDYIKHGQENNLTGQWMKELENASARFHISRLQSLQIQNQQVVEKLFGNQLDGLDTAMRQTYLSGYYHSAFEIQKGIGLGWNIGKIDERALDRVVNTPWTLDGRNFSDRIWTNKAALTAELQKQLTQNLMLGKAPDDSIRAIQEKFGVSRNQAARLVMTESAYFSSVSQQDCFNALGVEQYQIVATLDERTSDICREMDMQVFPMKEYDPGTTAPPFHPYCRTVTIPYYQDMQKVGERAARDPETDKTYYVPRDTTYRAWEKAFVNGGTKEGLKPVEDAGILDVAGKTIAACQTVKDVESWMKDRQWFRVGTTDQNERISLNGCDLDAAKEIARSYDEVFARYPALAGKLDSVRAVKLGGSTYAQCFTNAGGNVEVNTAYYKDAAALARHYEKDVASGFHPVGTDWTAIATHEIGHAIDGFLTKQGLAGVKSAYAIEYKDVSAMLRPEVMKACGLKVGAAYKEVSGYATKNAREWFAEAFAEGIKSNAPRQVASELLRRVDEMIGGLK